MDAEEPTVHTNREYPNAMLAMQDFLNNQPGFNTADGLPVGAKDFPSGTMVKMVLKDGKSFSFTSFR